MDLRPISWASRMDGWIYFPATLSEMLETDFTKVSEQRSTSAISVHGLFGFAAHGERDDVQHPRLAVDAVVCVRNHPLHGADGGTVV